MTPNKPTFGGELFTPPDPAYWKRRWEDETIHHNITIGHLAERTAERDFVLKTAQEINNAGTVLAIFTFLCGVLIGILLMHSL